MQTLEAMISLLFLLSICSQLTLSLDEERHIDDSLYRIQLAEDTWRVLYLRGVFRDFDASDRFVLEQELRLIKEETGLCIFIDGIVFTSCRSGEDPHQMTASLSKTVIYEGMPRNVTFSVGT